ncbi:MAG: DUF3168 domain-containing protein [Rubrimonas sp.]|uniref:DUF3168 domain-containing protein n=1 Tax=Rubrimonas sp. TaxID=2036015 RepID=UPI002FDD7D54
MSCAYSWPLQQALHGALSARPELSALVGGRIHDEAPADDALIGDDAAWVLLGDEQVSPWATASDAGAAHIVTLSVISTHRGFAVAKQVAGAVCEVALGPLKLSRGRVVNAGFLGAKTRRLAAGPARRIDLRFRIVIEDQA